MNHRHLTEGSSSGGGSEGGGGVLNIPSSSSSSSSSGNKQQQIITATHDHERVNGGNKVNGTSSVGNVGVVVQPRGGEEDVGGCSLMLLATAILLPPLGMAILLRFHLRHPMDSGEKFRQIVVCFLLTMLCYIPGLLHVIFAILQEEAGDQR